MTVLDLDALERQARDPASLGRSSIMEIPADRVLRLLIRLETADAVVAHIREGQDSDTIDDRLCGDTIHELLAAYDAARRGDAPRKAHKPRWIATVRAEKRWSL